ncbi:S10 family peptidase [Collimonas humicola]|uniref:S10 family peptidase n=1 Tax=Collimonas humicola TaxID=2825886 RepID=UPI001B8BBC58|nr:peptidase S10 [Collimonas humicola]
MSIKRKLLFGLAVSLQLCALAFAAHQVLAQETLQGEAVAARLPADQPYNDKTLYGFGAGDALTAAQVTENAAVTHNSISINGRTIRYTATAGHLTAADPKTGKPEASIFYVAYTADKQDAGKRPVTFFYNGGPGSSSVWLHLGSFSPKRIVTGDPATTEPLPFPFVDNKQSLIDTTDMVFVDAVGTGFSEAISPNTNQTFWGVDSDAAVFRDFVTRYLNANHRLESPKYLFGESYGTPRTDVLANLLEMAGTKLTGVVLQSAILNYNSNADFNGGSYGPYFPGYAAVGAYFNLVTPAPANLTKFAKQMRTFVAGSYEPAVDAFLASNTQPSADLLNQLFFNSGYTVPQWKADFNLDETTFRANLIPGSVIGRYDGRVVAVNGSPLAADGDPSSTLITQPFTDRMNDYLPHGLKYTAVSAYNIENGDTIQNWVWTHDGLPLPDTIPDLAAAIYQNPKLKVLSANGYHDLATPFYNTELDLGRLGPISGLQITHYRGGHMIYLFDPSRLMMKDDLVRYYGSRS